MTMLGDAIRANTAEDRPLLVIANDRDAYDVYRSRFDRDLYAVLLDPLSFCLEHGLGNERATLSEAAKREQAQRRKLRAELSDIRRKTKAA